jgi:hypothetical protein
MSTTTALHYSTTASDANAKPADLLKFWWSQAAAEQRDDFVHARRRPATTGATFMLQRYTRWPFGELRPHAYRVILADPPLKFSSGPNRNPNNHYPTMTIAQLATLPVSELAHPDGCRLILWFTFPHLHRATELMKAWGFRYSTGRPWVKLKPSTDEPTLSRDSLSRGTGYEVTNTC